MAGLREIILVSCKHLVLYIAAGLHNKQDLDCITIIKHNMLGKWQETEYFRRIG